MQYPSAGHVPRVLPSYALGRVCNETSAIGTKALIHLYRRIAMTVATVGGRVKTRLRSGWVV